MSESIERGEVSLWLHKLKNFLLEVPIFVALAIWKTKIVLLTLVSLDTENRNKVCSEPLPTTSLTSPMNKPTARKQKKKKQNNS